MGRIVLDPLNPLRRFIPEPDYAAGFSAEDVVPTLRRVPSLYHDHTEVVRAGSSTRLRIRLNSTKLVTQIAIPPVLESQGGPLSYQRCQTLFLGSGLWSLVSRPRSSQNFFSSSSLFNTQAPSFCVRRMVALVNAHGYAACT